MHVRRASIEIPAVPAAVTSAASFLDHAGTALGWLDALGHVRWANAALLKMLGRSELPEDGLELPVSRDDTSRWRQAIARSSGAESIVHVPSVRFSDTGSRLDVRLAALDLGGTLLEIEAFAEPASISVAGSLRSLAHELKNPLGGLRGAAQLLSRRVLDPDLRAYAEVIVSEVDRLRALTDRFLAPVAQSPLVAINLHGVLERVRLLLAAENTIVERDYDPSLPDCTGDRDRLLQAILNLVRNAVESGSSHVILRTRFERAARLARGRGDALRLDVVDDGSGVADAVRATLFLPLVSGREGGTGLGLAMAHEIVTEHGGRLAFESRPGHTVFSAWLPIDAGPQA